MVSLKPTITGIVLVIAGILLLTVASPYITTEVQSVQYHDIATSARIRVGIVYGGVDKPLSYSLPAGVTATGSLGVVNSINNQPSDIQMAVYDADNYQKWGAGQQSTFTFLNDVRDRSNFTFTTSNSGPYYFVFDNSASQYEKNVTISLGYNQISTSQVPDPRVPYLGWGLLATGLVVLAIGVIMKAPITWA
ncbi:MAG TPA: hypothetical protein VLV18_03575 [Terriglobales bacterium]|nr:hypothetical protein [Terriglobales bacterium]